ncbi:MAG: thiamine pyrophosphate-dependent dehydrogenase E1 component subunit alpha [Armatimonadetes bacterium]|nr:thiamine pyrophosphate-dependent dehydrogenase E1 component subunit alpha [Armatimonadota bacterium]
MLLIRLFEEKLDELFSTGVIKGTSHLYAGQEAVAVGVCAALRSSDYMTSTHRGHGHFLAKGGDPKRIMAELFGKATGYSKGRGGSQHMACIDIGFLGSNGITGGGIPIATGAALAVQMKQSVLKQQAEDSVVVCFFGEGGAHIGMFHESLNMAGIWKLPVIYLCENNLYAMSVPLSEASSVQDIAVRGASYNMPGVIVDGCDYFKVREVVGEAARRARAGEGPTLIEAKTYRYYGHSKSDKREYRTREEEAEWRQRDPLLLLRDRLRNTEGVEDSLLESIRMQVEAEVEEAVQFATEIPEPDPMSVMDEVFVTP